MSTIDRNVALPDHGAPTENLCKTKIVTKTHWTSSSTSHSQIMTSNRNKKNMSTKFNSVHRLFSSPVETPINVKVNQIFKSYQLTNVPFYNLDPSKVGLTQEWKSTASLTPVPSTAIIKSSTTTSTRTKHSDYLEQNTLTYWNEGVWVYM